LLLSLRQSNGDLQEISAAAALAETVLAMKADGIVGRAAIEALTEVDPATPPLSLRITGTDASGRSFEAFFCYEG